MARKSIKQLVEEIESKGWFVDPTNLKYADVKALHDYAFGTETKPTEESKDLVVTKAKEEKPVVAPFVYKGKEVVEILGDGVQDTDYHVLFSDGSTQHLAKSLFKRYQGEIKRS